MNLALNGQLSVILGAKRDIYILITGTKYATVDL